MENLLGMLFPIGTFGTLVLILLVQISFWFPTENKQQSSDVPRHRDTSSTDNSKTEDRPEVGEPSKARERRRPPPDDAISKQITEQEILLENLHCIFITDESSESDKTPKSPKENKSNETANRNAQRNQKTEVKGRIWKCACELGIFPAGILKTFGSAEAIMRLGLGQCYHKK